MKTCGKCRVVLSDDNSTRILSGKQAGYFQSYCRKCSVEYNRQRRIKNPEPYRQASLRWSLKPENKLKKLAAQKAHKDKFPERLKLTGRNSKIKKLYGLSSVEFDLLLESQKGLCKICGLDISGAKKHGKQSRAKACVDHDHATGKIRGLLCFKCNFILGLSDDSPPRLIAAANYLLTVPRTRGILT